MDSSLADAVQRVIEGSSPHSSQNSSISRIVSDHPKSPAALAGLLSAVAAHPQWASRGPSIAASLGDSIPWEPVFNILAGSATPESFPITSLASLTAVLRALGPKNAAALFSYRNWPLPILNDIVAQASLLVNPEDSNAGSELRALGLPPVLDVADFKDAPPHIKTIVQSLTHHPLNNAPLIRLALDGVCRDESSLASTDSLSVTRAYLDQYAKQVPELFLIGGAQVPRPWPALQSRIISSLFDIFVVGGHPSRVMVCYALVKIHAQPRFVAESFATMLAHDSALAPHIVGLCHEADVLKDLLNIRLAAGERKTALFMLELAALGEKQGLVLFETFLRKTLDSCNGSSLPNGLQVMSQFEFIGALFDFLEEKATADYSQPPSPSGLHLRTVAAALSLFSTLEISPDRIDQLKSIQIQCLQSYPRLINFGQGYDTAILAHSDVNSFSADVEREMKLYYQRMYEHKLEIRDIITMLQKLKKSDEPRDQDVFACMVHSLFDEYRFFPEYPLNALATTAVLFGSLIYFQLIEGLPLSIALRFILDSLKQSPDSNMFRFGLQALFEFRQRLPEFPKYCAILLEIPGLASHRQFFQQIKDIVNGANSGNLTGGDAVSLAPATEEPLPPSLFKSMNPQISVADEVLQEDPAEAVSDKVLFIVNNISQGNVAAKVHELKQFLEKRYFSWFAHYLVAQRAIQEPNYHSLYILMLEHLGSRELEQQCLRVTYFQISALVNDGDTLNVLEKRTQLKNLAQWLGSLLLGRNKPILHKNVDFKTLLIEGYDLQRLPVVIPFVCKTLDKASSSTVFLPPNPWLMGIMAVLSELYQFAELKLNLKFEIEVLCNQFKLDITKIEPSTIVRHRPVENSNGGEAVESGAPGLSTDMQRLRLEESAAAPGAVDNTATSRFGESMGTSLALVGSTVFATHPTLKRIFLLAVEKSIRDVLQPMVERSSTIAAVATRELIVKDFALELDEHKLRSAAKNLVRVLAGSISLVTCKEPLRDSMVANTRDILIAHGYAEHTTMEQLVMAVNDNVENVCQVVEAAAIEKAYVDIEEALAQAYIVRKHHIESGAAADTFVDPQLSSPYPFQLPDPFRLKTGGLTPQQFAIYESFGNYRSEPAPPTALVGSVDDQTESFGVAAGVEVSGAQLDQLILQIQSWVDSLEKLLEEASEDQFSDLPAEHPIQGLISRLLLVVTRSPFQEELILKTSQMTVSALFTVTNSQLGRETLCYLLERLCKLSSTTAKEVVLWLIYSDDERKYNVSVMETLIRCELITPAEIDANLAKQVLARLPAAIEFACGLIRALVLGAEPLCLRTEFTGTLEALAEAVSASADEAPKEELTVATMSAKELFNDLASLSASALAVSSKGSGANQGENGSPQATVYLANIFAEWVRLVQHPAATQRLIHVFVHDLATRGILGDRDLLLGFIRVSTEVAIRTEGLAAVDSLAKLLATIAVTNSPVDRGQRLQYAQNILSVVILMLASDHDKKQEEFNSRPYFRLFSTFFWELSEWSGELTAKDDGDAKAEDQGFLEDLYILLAKLLDTIQPLALPGFSFAWTTLISHRFLLPKLMELPEKRGWPHVALLIECLVRFEGTYIEGKHFLEPITVMYKGALRVLLVLLHDYPEFLIENHYTLCNAIPASFVQLRNLVLSAFPENIQLPDPLTQGLKVDRLPEIRESPKLAVDPGADLQKRVGLRKLVDTYVKSPSQALVKTMVSSLKLSASEPISGIGFSKVTFNRTAINALVLYVGVEAVADKSPSGTTANSNDESSSAHFNRDSVHLALLAQLMVELPAEGRYFLCEAMADQLRYPNAHTHFFSCVVLSLFGSYGTQALGDEKFDTQHIITRVLLERIICNRPHPWGLMITFTELLKNSNYKFWELPFTRATPEIERMFASLYSHISNRQAETERGAE